MPIGPKCRFHQWCVQMVARGDQNRATLIGREQVEEVLRVLSKGRVTDGADNWSRRFKANSEKLRSGDIQMVAEVVRNLSIRDRQKGLSTGERRMLNRARKILSGEIAVALKLEAEEAEEVLEKALS